MLSKGRILVKFILMVAKEAPHSIFQVLQIIVRLGVQWVFKVPPAPPQIGKFSLFLTFGLQLKVI